MKNLVHNFCDCATCEKNQEKAEKYEKFFKDFDEIRNYQQIIERLKAFFNGDNVLTKSEYKQKILGEDHA